LRISWAMSQDRIVNLAYFSDMLIVWPAAFYIGVPLVVAVLIVWRMQRPTRRVNLSAKA
jgi:hypothetical protein